MRRHALLLRGLLAAALMLLATPTAVAQTASLFQQDLPAVVGAPPLTLEQASLYFQAPEPLRQIKLHDLLTVIVVEKSQVISEGEMQRRKNAVYNSVLKDWLRFDGFSVLPAPQNEGDLRVNGELNNQYRATSELETRDAMSFSITAEVVDIRPNGLLVIEARQHIENNDDVWERSLVGLVRPEDITPANTVMSEKIAELRIYKWEKGYVRDGYRRGWFSRIFDVIQPF